MTIPNTERNFMLLGHRGFRGVLENTLPAFRRALKYADGIEFDVRLTGDRKLVTLHDGEFRANGKLYRVRELTYRELLRLHPHGRLVPRVKDVIKLSPEILNADIKDPEVVEKLIEKLERRNLLERTVISADNLGLALKIQRECPDCRVGFSIISARNLLMSLRLMRNVYSIHIPLDLTSYLGVKGVLTLIELYRRKGLRVWLWNYRMDELALLPELMDRADAVIADDPARVKRFISLQPIGIEATRYVG
ncbi:glycerophosphodiester phosphodiesterase family protein [Thermococcus sp.]|uniref:glycerophosphodiester phosphodiesterase family protein n=1 Tax=Thermococcus sp. TaxID=35749 RepID=UPI002619982B|nr:glycerophosphodiester phosphodiesterase family protein [Thermococcus sp.]